MSGIQQRRSLKGLPTACPVAADEASLGKSAAVAKMLRASTALMGAFLVNQGVGTHSSNGSLDEQSIGVVDSLFTSYPSKDELKSTALNPPSVKTSFTQLCAENKDNKLLPLLLAMNICHYDYKTASQIMKKPTPETLFKTWALRLKNAKSAAPLRQFAKDQKMSGSKVDGAAINKAFGKKFGAVNEKNEDLLTGALQYFLARRFYPRNRFLELVKKENITDFKAPGNKAAQWAADTQLLFQGLDVFTNREEPLLQFEDWATISSCLAKVRDLFGQHMPVAINDAHRFYAVALGCALGAWLTSDKPFHLDLELLVRKRNTALPGEANIMDGLGLILSSHTLLYKLHELKNYKRDKALGILFKWLDAAALYHLRAGFEKAEPQLREYLALSKEERKELLLAFLPPLHVATQQPQHLEYTKYVDLYEDGVIPCTDDKLQCECPGSTKEEMLALVREAFAKPDNALLKIMVSQHAIRLGLVGQNLQIPADLMRLREQLQMQGKPSKKTKKTGGSKSSSKKAAGSKTAGSKTAGSKTAGSKTAGSKTAASSKKIRSHG